MNEIFRFLKGATAQQLMVILGIGALVTPPAPAHDHVLPLSDIYSALSRARSVRQRNQADIDRFLSNDRVQITLRRAGVDATQIRQTASLLSDDDHARLAARARGAEADLSAGELKDNQVTIIILCVTGFAVLSALVLAFK